MAISAWFDYNGYMANKLVQVQKAEPAANWDMMKLVKAFSDANFAGADGAEKHFEEFGQYEDVAPNAFFNPTEYFRAKAAQFYGKDPKAVTDLDVASIQVAIKDAGMSAWSHYEQFGNTEKVNPSNSFDTEAYMNAKHTALNSVKDGKQYTLPEVYDAFKAAGLSALEHFMLFGGNGDGEVAQKYEGKIPAEFAVPEAKKVNPGGGSEGKTFSLTTETDLFTGDANNNTFIAGKDDTLTAGDQLDGVGGTNTLKLYGDNSTRFDDASIKNIQIVQNYTDVSLDVSTNAGVEEVWAMKLANKVITASVDQKIGFGGAGTTEIAEFMGTGAAATIGLSDAGKTAAFTSLTVDDTGTGGAAKIEKLTLELSGKNQITEIDAQSLQELVITGTGSLKSDNANANLGASATPTIKSIDASANTGGVELGLTVANLRADAVIKGGSGNDKFILDANITNPVTISGGSGDDTLLIGGTNAMAKPNAKNITGFEYLEFNGLATHDLDAYTGTLDTLKGVIVSDAVTGVSNLQGDALHNVRYTFDGAAGGTLTGKGFAAAVSPSNNKAGIVLDNSVNGAANTGCVDLTGSLTFADVRGLTIESVAGASVLKANGTLTTTSSIEDLTSTTLTSLTLKGNDSIGIKIAATTTALSEVDASGLTNGAGMYLDLVDSSVTTIGVKGSAGNDFVNVDGSTNTVTLNYITNGGHDKIALTAVAATDTVNIVQDDATLKGASVAVDSDFNGGVIAATGVVKLDLSTELAGALMVNDVKLVNIGSVAVSGSFTGKGTAIAEGGDFAANTNIMFGVSTATLVIQIDVNGDGKFAAADDYQVSIVGVSANSTFGYVAADGDFTFTSAS